MGLPQIICWTLPLAAAGGAPGDHTAVAFTEDGEMLVSTIVSAVEARSFFRQRAALDRFTRRFPGGFDLEFIGNPEVNPRVAAIVKAHRALGADGDRRR